MPIFVNKVRDGRASAGQGCSTAMQPRQQKNYLQNGML